MIIIDGYNVIHKWESLSKFLYNIDIARSRLINILSNYQGFSGEEIVVVFDSQRIESSVQDEEILKNIKIIYAAGDKGADIFIEQLVNTSTVPETIKVVTGDLQERVAVSRKGAATISPERFEEEVLKVCNYKKSY